MATTGWSVWPADLTDRWQARVIEGPGGERRPGIAKARKGGGFDMLCNGCWRTMADAEAGAAYRNNVRNAA